MNAHPDFPVIDSHVHLYPDALAPRVTPALAARFGNPPAFDGTVNGCRDQAARAGIVLSVNLPVATDPGHVDHTNAFWHAYATSRPGTVGESQVLSLAALHPLTPDLPDVIAQLVRDGFRGIKFHPEYQHFRFNDAALDDTWAALAEHGLVAYLHAGGERVFQPPFHSTPHEIATLHRRFPKLRIVAAHLGGFGMWDECEEVLIGQDVWLDLSHTFFWMDDAQILRMIHAHGPHRILFGTDAPWQTPAQVLDAFLALPMNDEERRRICYDNAAELLRL